MAKQYVVTEPEFQALLQTLELHKYKLSNNLQTSLMVECKDEVARCQAGELPNGISERLTAFVMDEAHRLFHYYVYNWVQEMKK